MADIAALQARIARLAAAARDAQDIATEATESLVQVEAREEAVAAREADLEARSAAHARLMLERQRTEEAVGRRVRTAEEQYRAVVVGEARKEAAIAAVHRASTDGAWKIDFLARFGELVANGQRFTTDDVLDYVGYPPSGKPQIIGACTNAATKKYEVEIVDVQPSSRATRNGTRVTVWQSRATAHRTFATV